MRTTCIGMALEAIDHQGDQLFRDLTASLKALRLSGKRLSQKAFWDSEGVQDLTNIIRERTGITIYFNDAGMNGPYVLTPLLDANHPFLADWIKALVMDGIRFDAEQDIRKIMKTMDTDLVRGQVDLAKSRVSGVFTRMPMNMFMPRDIMDSDRLLNAEETAAVILHELGHCFTYMEMAGRTLTTNQVLAGMLRVNDGTRSADVRETVFAKGRDLLKMNKEQREALLNAKGDAEVTAIVLDSAITLSRSELGFNIYDHVACEQMADQFCTRHGAGRPLVVALDKLGGMDTGTFGSWQGIVNNVMSISLTLFAGIVFPLGVGLCVLFLLAITSEHHIPEHNNDLARLNRVKHEINERLKNQDISVHEKKSLLKDAETVAAIASRYHDTLGWVQAISYMLRPNYRNGRKFQILQNQLEALGANDLFAKAAKLSTI